MAQERDRWGLGVTPLAAGPDPSAPDVKGHHVLGPARPPAQSVSPPFPAPIMLVTMVPGFRSSFTVSCSETSPSILLVVTRSQETPDDEAERVGDDFRGRGAREGQRRRPGIQLPKF